MPAKNIILGATGGIAAYKAPELVRRLRDRGATVQVVMTRSAAQFVTATSLQAVSGRPVRDNLWDSDAEAAMGHIELARWADLVLIAPCTAEMISRLAAGAAPDLLTTLCLATEAPLVLAPAMNRVMWAHPAVQANCEILAWRGVRLIGPDEGDQACGETGTGRMVQPVDIAIEVMGPAADAVPQSLEGRTVVVTAGPTREAIDPVRYISNRSSGKMGYEIARAAAAAGARVVLLSGPVDLAAPEGIEIVSVETANELLVAARRFLPDADIFIAAAAVSDYAPALQHSNKIKKDERHLNIELERTPDVLATVAGRHDAPFTVGFAAETENVREYALSKLKDKNLDMIVANRVGPGLGFGQDDNAVEVYWTGGEQSFPLTAKEALAGQLIELIAERYESRYSADTQTELPTLAIRD